MSSTEQRALALFDRWNARFASAGEIALASAAVALVTGVVLAAGYDVRAALDSVAMLQLASLPGRFVRAVHAWSSHLALIACVLHAAEQVLRRGEKRLRPGAWVRVVLAAPLPAAIALTGFMMRGDAEGRLARDVVTGLLELPGRAVSGWSSALLGTGGDLQLVYVLHAATLPVALLLISIEHGRRIWPGAGSLLAVGAASVLLGWVFPPGLHDGASPVVKGPWYFLAMQEMLHWLDRPGWSYLVLSIPLAALLALPFLAPRRRFAAVLFLALLLLAYAAAGLWAALFRGPGWSLVSPWAETRPASATAVPTLSPIAPASLAPGRIVLVQGRREGCLACHDNVQGIEASHDPEALGCASCHLGNAFAPDAAGAHAGMILVPGNLDAAERTCGQASCHGAIVARVRRSPMATVSGMIAVDRFAFGEAATPDGSGTPATLGESPADTHLKQLCVVCHLPTPKSAPAAVSETSRGGGCAACHLRESPRRTAVRDNPGGFVHPALGIAVSDDNCFGCHSRSGRISLGYAGWAESEASAPGEKWKLADGRILRRAGDDAHHAAGMACVDCHLSGELMGTGQSVLHEEQATRIRCTTCHRIAPARAVALASTDAETRAIAKLRNTSENSLLVEDASGEPVTNAWPAGDGKVVVLGKLDGRRRSGVPPAQACFAVRGHERLSCQACHSAWAPRCVGCHTQADGKDWVEYDVPPQTAEPTLGILRRDGREMIEPVVPGMIMTLNKERPHTPGRLPESSDALVGPHTRFLRAYAYSVPHTTTKKGRTCRSCHSDPAALGYGAGLLKHSDGHWTFEPAYRRLDFDGLPADAWIGFPDDRVRPASTRIELRPLDRETRARTLAVGGCMECHDPERDARLYADFRQSLARRTAECRTVEAP